ncbi:hypothetical protein GQS_02250 [Thermococcus sp. 4557]|nr:hypothetical protein GQS_02250 [Thermococcus sp. 4557]
MDAGSLLESALKLQNLIVSGSLEVSAEGVLIWITRDDVVVDIIDAGKLLKVASPLMKMKRGEGGITGKLEVLKQLKGLEEVANRLDEGGKTVFLMYQGQEVIVMGFKANPAIFGLKNIEVRGKLQMVRLSLAFLRALL